MTHLGRQERIRVRSPRGASVLLAATLLAVGCITQAVVFPTPGLPDVSAAPGAPIIGLAPIGDQRLDERIGGVGALRLTAGPGLAPIVNAAVKSGLVGEGLRVVAAPNPADLGTTPLSNVFNGRVVTVTITLISLNSADAILDPVDSAVGILVRVHDRDGQILYGQSHTGEHKAVLGFTGSTKKEGKMLAEAARDSVGRLFSDASFLEAIR